MTEHEHEPKLRKTAAVGAARKQSAQRAQRAKAGSRASLGDTPPVKAVSFDLFDTLVDLRMETLPEFALGERRQRGTQALLHAALPAETRARWTLADFVREDDALRAERTAGARELPTLERFGELCTRFAVADRELPARLTQLHMEEIFRRTAYLEHHTEVLGSLAAAGLRLAVCSNFSHTPTAERVLRAARLHEHFAAVVVSADGGVRKPRAEIFAEVAARLGLEPTQILHVGDRLDEDVAGARAAGMRTGWITRRVAEPELALGRHGGTSPELTLGDLAELAEKIRSLTRESD